MISKNSLVLLILYAVSIISLYLLSVQAQPSALQLFYAICLLVVFGMIFAFAGKNVAMLFNSLVFAFLLLILSYFAMSTYNYALLMLGGAAIIGFLYSVFSIRGVRSKSPMKYSRRREALDEEMQDINVEEPQVIIEDYRKKPRAGKTKARKKPRSTKKKSMSAAVKKKAKAKKKASSKRTSSPKKKKASAKRKK